MKKYLSLIAIFSLFVVQIHEIGHSESSKSDIDHHCTICKISSYQHSLTPKIIDFNYSFNLFLIEIFITNERDFVCKYFISKIIKPRAPPNV
ncbi:MAG: hypothetical protein HOJ35_01635 [Bdellovibrionales bacterium]|jgi:hypothetical protein|nr:hypothetical protein [Bdellovibrionales bacterium]